MPGVHSIRRYVCKGCVAVFFRPAMTGKRGRQKYGPFCNSACFYKWVKGRQMAKCRQLRLRLSSKLYYKCPHCGADTSARPYQRNKYCSKKCFLAQVKIDAAIERTCTGCGKKWTERKSRRKRIGKRMFCSRACHVAFSVGKNNPLWRGNRRHERGPTWKTQAALARERDGHRCAKCATPSRRGQLVSVDHIVPYRLAVLYAAPLGLDPNDLGNLVSLCRLCHSRKTHIEARILCGDLLGFEAEAKAIIPLERLRSALELFGLSEKVAA